MTLIGIQQLCARLLAVLYKIYYVKIRLILVPIEISNELRKFQPVFVCVGEPLMF